MHLQTENLIFYHGTSRQSARAILINGASEAFLAEIGALNMGRLIYNALMAKAGLDNTEAWRLSYSFKIPGLEDSGLWANALQGLENPDLKLFQYGHVFVTLNVGNAYRYALGNRYRSEFILAIAESLQILEHIDASLASDMSRDFPQVMSLVRNPDQAVVLEISGISRQRLQTERGSDEIDGTLETYTLMTKYSGVSSPCAFRVRDLSAKDILAVHDLSNWNSDEVHDPLFQPDSIKIRNIRLQPHVWLEKSF